MQDQFSVSMCVYGGDRADWFSQAVESILKQTVVPSEIVLVVDGPVPEELEVCITKYDNNPLFHVIRLLENRGHGEARRIGLQNCRYDIVALMDADDISVADRFEQQLPLFRDGADVVGGNICEFVQSPTLSVGQRVVPERDSDIKEYLKKRCPMNQVTVMFRRQKAEQVGGYIDWFCEEDYYLWLRLFLAGARFANTGTVLVNVRVGEEMYQRRGGWRYFVSEARLQRYMRRNHIIGWPRYAVNVTERFLLQVLMPNSCRAWVFKTFARTKKA